MQVDTAQIIQQKLIHTQNACSPNPATPFLCKTDEPGKSGPGLDCWVLRTQIRGHF
jgi:hypothetical protein